MEHQVIATIIFFICVLAIEFGLFYSPLYLIGYKVCGLDKTIGDGRLALILVILTIALSILFFKQVSGFLYYIIF